MPLVLIPPACYDALTKMKNEITEEKKKADKPTKTTYGECIHTLLKEAGRLPDITLIPSEDGLEGAFSELSSSCPSSPVLEAIS